LDRARSHDDPWHGAAAWLQRRVPHLLAVIGHGAAGTDERIPGAPLEVVAAVRVLPPPPRRAALQAAFAGRTPGASGALTIVEAHQLGWLPPSVFQQSLLSTATLLWGDAAAVRVIPSWRPDQLDPRLALDEQEGAEADLAAGWPARAALRAAGALLIARRRYEPRGQRRAAALRAAWPEAPAVSPLSGGEDAARFVTTARRLLHDWLFTWEGEGPGSPAVARYTALWRASRAPARP
jgi:hypothetical protein